MIFITTIIISIIGLIIATYTDLKERIVPNKLNFGLAILGLTIYAIQSIIELNIYPIIYSFLGLCIGFSFGWILWKLGVFAGGDVKLFMALGALNPFTPALIKIGLLTNSSLPIFPISLFLYSLIAFMPYGIVVIVYKLLNNKTERKKIFFDMKKNTIIAIHTAFFLSGSYIIINLFIQNTVIEIFLVFIFLFVWNFLNKNKIILTSISMIIGIFLNYQMFFKNLLSLTIIIVILFGLIKLMTSMKILMSKKVLIKNLKEGMIPGITLIWKGKKVIIKEKLSLKEIIKQIKENTLNSEKEIISSMRACGLTIQEIKELKKLSKQGLIEKTILIKDSIPFVPTILLGYILSVILGDFIINLILSI
ncbi:MAG: prepilin peptidase [Candidatus ainarchaeum sp.]|nr:prepilin peptidase [Candidatus ainarchaeum sp.]